MDPEALYFQLGELMRSMPDLREYGEVASETRRWLGRAYALVRATGDIQDTERLRTISNWVGDSDLEGVADEIETILYRALAVSEMAAPMTVRGSYIPVGGSFDVVSALSKILSESSKGVLVVDPYLDQNVLTDFAVLAPEGVNIRLFADQAAVKPGLAPAAHRWVQQYGATRPLEIRLAKARSLHDRLIVCDNQRVWLLTQSLNAIAQRSPAVITPIDPETAKLKIAAYDDLWRRSTKVE